MALIELLLGGTVGYLVGREAKTRRSNPSDPKCRTGTVVQTLLFPRWAFSKQQAKSWAKRNNYRYGKVDTTPSYYRLRQHDPGMFVRDSFRTIWFGSSNIQAVVGCPRKRM